MITTRTPLHSIGDGRYRTSTPPSDGPLRAEDTRLGRGVLLQCGVRALPSERLATRLAAVRHPGVVPLLDAGDDVDDDAIRRAYTVFPVGTEVALDAVDPERWCDLATSTVAAVAAWLVASALAVRTACGTTVALRSSDVVVDASLFTGTGSDADCPVRWLPSLADRDDDLPGVVAALVMSRSRREQRRFGSVVSLLESPGGAPRAVRLLAATAGLDPRVVGLAPHVPHHAGTQRRSFGRRLVVGDLPTTTRSECSCASVEAFS